MSGNRPEGAAFEGEAPGSPFVKVSSERCGLKMSLHTGEK